MQVSFTVSNQRTGLYSSHRMPDLNRTRSVRVVAKSLTGGGGGRFQSDLADLANKELYHHLFLSGEDEGLVEGGKVRFYRSATVRIAHIISN